MQGNVHHPNYDAIRRNEKPNIDQGANGHYFPPKHYLAKSEKGPMYTPDCKVVLMEPGVQLTCPDCDKTTEGADHFKYRCGKWQCRVRLQKTFVYCAQVGYGVAVGQHHLNNEAINAMIEQGVTLERVARQPDNWLPNEPLYDFDPITGVYESTGVVPVNVWYNLPADMRKGPMPQDNSTRARFEAQGDCRRRTLTQMNAPRNLEDKAEDEYLVAFYEGQCDVRDNYTADYQSLLNEYRQIKRENERLQSQIGSAKCAVGLLMAANHLTAFGGNGILAQFDGPVHPHFVPALLNCIPPTLPVPAGPPSAVETQSQTDINQLTSM